MSPHARVVRAGIGALTLVVAVSRAEPVRAYLTFGVPASGGAVVLKWSRTPVRYFVNDGGTDGVSAADLQAAAGRAFATWEAVPSSSIAYELGGVTSALPGEDDGQSTLGFRDRPDLDHVLASTSLFVDEGTGELLEADIFFNTAFPWSVASGGAAGRFDLESIALHEIGHFSGLGHSALGETELRADGTRRVTSAEAVMFPIAFDPGSIAGRTLKADDVAGISDLYPADGFAAETGSISGHVTKNGRPVLGAHVVAFDPVNGTMVGALTLGSSGDFSMGGLSPGPHVLRVEPLDDSDTDSYFDASAPVDLDFRVTFFDRLVIVPKGADTGILELTVEPK